MSRSFLLKPRGGYEASVVERGGDGGIRREALHLCQVPFLCRSEQRLLILREQLPALLRLRGALSVERG